MDVLEKMDLDWNDLRLTLHPDVYAPKEDSFLLANAAEKHAFGRVLDLGCGTGIVGIIAAENSKTRSVTFADVSQAALSLSAHNVRQNAVRKPVEFVKTDLFAPLAGVFDTILFNPPYLPTGPEEKLVGNLNHAFDGGKDGRKVLDRFLKTFSPHLASGGVLFLLNSSISSKDGLSGNRQTKNALEKRGFSVDTLASQRFFFEELVVFKAVKKNRPS